MPLASIKIMFYNGIDVKKRKKGKTGPGRKTTMKCKNLLSASLSEQETEAIKNFQKNLDNKFRALQKEHNLSNKAMADLFYPFIEGPDKVSKIGIDPQYHADVRHCNMKILAALRLVFGISIDEILDQELKPRVRFDEPT